MELCQNRRGMLVDMKFVTATRGSIIYEIPLAEVRLAACYLQTVLPRWSEEDCCVALFIESEAFD